MYITTLTTVLSIFVSFFFAGTATTDLYTLSLHDALPIFEPLNAVAHVKDGGCEIWAGMQNPNSAQARVAEALAIPRSEEHTSELQSPCNLVCRLLLEKKKKIVIDIQTLIVQVQLILSRVQ